MGEVVYGQSLPIRSMASMRPKSSSVSVSSIVRSGESGWITCWTTCIKPSRFFLCSGRSIATSRRWKCSSKSMCPKFCPTSRAGAFTLYKCSVSVTLYHCKICSPNAVCAVYKREKSFSGVIISSTPMAWITVSWMGEIARTMRCGASKLLSKAVVVRLSEILG